MNIGKAATVEGVRTLLRYAVSVGRNDKQRDAFAIASAALVRAATINVVTAAFQHESLLPLKENPSPPALACNALAGA